MRMNDLSIKGAGRVIQTALDVGINFFDHADIYGGGESEQIFAEAFQSTSASRENIRLLFQFWIGYKYFPLKQTLIFAEAFQSTSASRENIYIQSKTGIRDGYFDFSKDHILQSVDGSLQRLNTDYLDVLLL